jgi:hypothetical protein
MQIVRCYSYLLKRYYYHLDYPKYAYFDVKIHYNLPVDNTQFQSSFAVQSKPGIDLCFLPNFVADMAFEIRLGCIIGLGEVDIEIIKP